MSEKSLQVNHLAIIMDGNGRWAQARGLERTAGHKAGAENVLNIMRAAQKFNIKYLTLYAFSTENWKRPAAEVGALMKLLQEFLLHQLPAMQKKLNGLPLILKRLLHRLTGSLTRLHKSTGQRLNRRLTTLHVMLLLLVFLLWQNKFLT